MSTAFLLIRHLVRSTCVELSPTARSRTRTHTRRDKIQRNVGSSLFRWIRRDCMAHRRAHVSRQGANHCQARRHSPAHCTPKHTHTQTHTPKHTHTHTLTHTTTTTSLSLGATVKFQLRRMTNVWPCSGGDDGVDRTTPPREVLLGDGDLFAMLGPTQQHWHHRVPKTKGRRPRININFRYNNNIDLELYYSQQYLSL